MGGTRTWENELFRNYSAKISQIQAKIRSNSGATVPRRAQHAKTLVGVTNAEFRIAPHVPDGLLSSFFQPGAAYSASVRFSNCSGEVQPDSKNDLRGVGIRVSGEDGIQDFLLTNGPASHARDPQQFIAVAVALASRWKLLILPRMVLNLGISETIRILRVLQGASRHVDSLSAERFWSRAPIALGSIAVKYFLEPYNRPTASVATTGNDYLRSEFRERLKREPVTFGFKVQRFVDELSTPIEDGSVVWEESISPPEEIAYLTIPQQDLNSASADEMERFVDNLEFNPWNTVDGFRPLGSLNRARRRVYQTSADNRSTPMHS
jgi:hypothetical protein